MRKEKFAEMKVGSQLMYIAGMLSDAQDLVASGDKEMANNVINNANEINTSLFNSEDLIKFINLKKPFDNLSDFQYYPFKLFHEVLNE